MNLRIYHLIEKARRVYKCTAKQKQIMKSVCFLSKLYYMHLLFQLCARMTPTATFPWVSPATGTGRVRAGTPASSAAPPCWSSTRSAAGAWPRQRRTATSRPPTPPSPTRPRRQSPRAPDRGPRTPDEEGEVGADQHQPTDGDPDLRANRCP